MKAAIYTRISQDTTGESLGVQRQLDDCIDLATKLGFEVVAHYNDNDTSAYSSKPRPQFEKMLTAMQAREFTGLVVWHTDRLYRQVKDLERLIPLADGLTIKAVNSGELDLSNSTGKMVARILGSVAQAESEHKGERQRRANVQKAASGKWQTANRPFGYTMQGVPLEPEASMYRTAVTDVLGGKSINQVAREWNLTPITGTLGTTWKSSRMRRLLVNPRYAALKVHQGKVVGPGDWEPLIDVDTHRGLVAFLSDPARITCTSFEKKYMGSGVYKCGVCGGAMRHSVPGGKSPGGRRYECSVKQCVVRIGEPLDEAVEHVLLDWVVKNRHKLVLRRDAKGADLAELNAAREAIDARMNELIDMFTAGEIDRQRYNRSNADLATQMLAIDNTLAATKMRSPLADLAAAGETRAEIESYWNGLSADVRGKIIQEAGDVVVNPAPRGRGFNPEYVEIDWKIPGV
ncbi:MAG: serine recombinase [Mycobacterium sp.]|nr:serine recombinase [Mycobacterium sp.]